MLALLSSELRALPRQARTHLNDNQGQLALQQEEETLADPIRCMPGLEGSTSPQSPCCDGSSYQPRTIISRQGQNTWPAGEMGGERIWTHCKQKEKVSCLDAEAVKAQFSQELCLFKPPGFSGVTLLLSAALLSG